MEEQEKTKEKSNEFGMQVASLLTYLFVAAASFAMGVLTMVGCYLKSNERSGCDICKTNETGIVVHVCNKCLVELMKANGGK